MTSDLLALPPIDGRSPRPFAPVKVDPVALAQAVAEGLQLFQEYADYRAAHGMPPSTLMVWPFVLACAPAHLHAAIAKWMDDMTVPSLPN